MSSVGLINPDHAAELLDARDPEAFSERLLSTAHSAAGVDELFAYRIGDGPPVTLASSSDLEDADERSSAYSRRFHRSDPAVIARQSVKPGNGFVCRIPASAIELGAYRKLCFERPRFSEKICFGWREHDYSLVVTFYHRNAEPDMAQLGALAQIAITGLTRLTRRPVEGASLVERLEHRLAETHRKLTRRECEICARTLAGHNSRRIGDELSLSNSTVLTYRQRAYRKLSISSANELLPAIMT